MATQTFLMNLINIFRDFFLPTRTKNQTFPQEEIGDRNQLRKNKQNLSDLKRRVN
jgi:hypothetical protein